MGLIAKSLTKRKVAAESGPDNVVAASPLEKSLLCAARVRTAMLARSIGGVSSQTGRGNVSIFAFSKGSQFCFSRSADNSWAVTLGTLGDKSRPISDWVLEASLIGEHRVVVTTPEYLTVDGALANPKVYDDVRSGLLSAFSHEDVGDQAESELCRRSLNLTPRRGVRVENVATGPVELRITGTRVEIEHKLAQIGLQMSRPNETDLVWRSALGDAFLHLVGTEFDGTVTWKGNLRFAENWGNYRLACAHAAAACWRNRAPLVLLDLDPDFQILWPEPA